MILLGIIHGNGCRVGIRSVNEHLNGGLLAGFNIRGETFIEVEDQMTLPRSRSSSISSRVSGKCLISKYPEALSLLVTSLLS